MGATRTLINRTVSSLALLKVNWDHLCRDYLENFVPIVAECIRLSEDSVVSVGKVQTDLTLHFGLAIPQNAIRTILGRVRKRKYIKLENGVLKPNRKQLDSLRFRNTQQHVRAFVINANIILPQQATSRPLCRYNDLR